MSVAKGFWLVCDSCDDHRDQIANSVRQARTWAAEDAKDRWHYAGAQRDICSVCWDKGER